LSGSQIPKHPGDAVPSLGRHFCQDANPGWRERDKLALNPFHRRFMLPRSVSYVGRPFASGGRDCVGTRP
jgi:hypothetical protein